MYLSDKGANVLQNLSTSNPLSSVKNDRTRKQNSISHSKFTKKSVHSKKNRNIWLLHVAKGKILICNC